MTELPPNWKWQTLPEIVTKDKHSIKRGPFGGSLKKEIFVASGYKVYEQKNAINNNFDIGTYFITKGKYEEMKAFSVKPDDIIISCSGTIGKIAIVPKDVKEGIINQALLKITLDKNKARLLFFKYLFESDIIQKRLTKISRGVAIKNVPSVKNLKEIKFSIPETDEQDLIIQEIETQFTRLDAVVKSLISVKKQLDVYRKSVLKAAFEGKLTESWRQQNPQEISTIHILSEIKTLNSSKKVRKSKGKSMFNGYDVKQFHKEWKLLKLDKITEKITDGAHKTPTYVDSGIFFISVKDIYNRKVHFGNCKYISKKEHKDLFRRCNPEKGDLLVTKSGTIGRIAVIDTNQEFSLFVSVALIKLYKKIFNPYYIAFALEDYINKIDIDKTIKGALLKNFHIEDLREIILPICSKEEQNQIVDEIESRFSVIDKIDQTVNASLKKAEQLRKSILKSAFEGKLVKYEGDNND